MSGYETSQQATDTGTDTTHFEEEYVCYRRDVSSASVTIIDTFCVSTVSSQSARFWMIKVHFWRAGFPINGC